MYLCKHPQAKSRKRNPKAKVMPLLAKRKLRKRSGPNRAASLRIRVEASSKIQSRDAGCQVMANSKESLFRWMKW
jgi:hypothetical protein